MKPPFSYYGGKQSIVHHLIKCLPMHTVYVEPFAGSAALFHAKPKPAVVNSQHYREVINDLDGELINFFRCLRDHNEELCRQLSLTLYSREEFVDSQILIDDDPITRARKFLIRIACTFSGKSSGKWWRIGKLAGNHPATLSKRIEMIPSYVSRLRGVYMDSDSASSVIRRWDSPSTLFYCDPPYPSADQSGYHFAFTMGDMEKLVALLNNADGASVVSAYGNCDHLFGNDWARYQINVTASCIYPQKTEADRQRTEWVWVRLNRARPRDEIVSLYNSGAYDCYPLGYYDGAEVITPQTRRGQMALL